MGSPNFGGWCGIGGAFGLLPDYPTDEDLTRFREEMDYTEDTDVDELTTLYMEDQYEWVYDQMKRAEAVLPDRIQNVVDALWQFGYLSNAVGIPFPYELQIDIGYHWGWRATIASRYCRSNEQDDTLWLAYRDLINQRTAGVPHISFVDFCAHVEKVSDAVVWAFENFARGSGWSYITGGWAGSERRPYEEDFTPIAWREKWEQMFPLYK